MMLHESRDCMMVCKLRDSHLNPGIYMMVRTPRAPGVSEVDHSADKMSRRELECNEAWTIACVHWSFGSWAPRRWWWRENIPSGTVAASELWELIWLETFWSKGSGPFTQRQTNQLSDINKHLAVKFCFYNVSAFILFFNLTSHPQPSTIKH